MRRGRWLMATALVALAGCGFEATGRLSPGQAVMFYHPEFRYLTSDDRDTVAVAVGDEGMVVSDARDDPEGGSGARLVRVKAVNGVWSGKVGEFRREYLRPLR